MKILLTLVVAVIIIVYIADGGDKTNTLRFDPDIKIGYQPDNTTNTTNIENYVESQTVIYQQNPVVSTSNTESDGGVTLVDPQTQLCTPLPGETIYQGPDTKGACFVEDPDGNRWFLNAAGSRFLLENPNKQVNPGPIDFSSFTLAELEQAYTESGGTFPWSWGVRSDEIKRLWLLEKLGLQGE